MVLEQMWCLAGASGPPSNMPLLSPDFCPVRQEVVFLCV
jgi:hypothetical protein